ncbi:MAG: NADH-quinone oxidoreductase subunit J [Nitrospira sp.]|nr:NADH-quinone oxidoreductase subunit J [Nitrospira sp.]
MPAFPPWSLHRYRARESGVTVAIFVFLYFAAIILVTASLVVALRNPIYSALSLLVMFFHVAGLYVTLHAEFLAAIQIIVYAGAILVLYLFVVMLLNVKRDERYSQQGPVALFLGAVLLTEAILLAVSHGLTVAAPSHVAAGERVAGNTESIGEVLYSTYLFPFELASLILLVAMIGAVILSKKGIMESKPRSGEGTTHQSPGGVI